MTNRLFADSGLKPFVSCAIVLAHLHVQLRAQQIGVPPGFQQPIGGAKPTPAPAQQPPPNVPAQPAQQPGAQAAPSAAPVPTSTTAGLNLQNASLREVIDILARQLRINYILDPRVQGSVTINTYGETKAIDNRALLDTILRINNAAMIPQGDIYRIVPISDVLRMPGLKPEL